MEHPLIKTFNEVYYSGGLLPGALFNIHFLNILP